MKTDEFTFKGKTMNADKAMRRRRSPRRKFDIIEKFSALFKAEIETISIDKQFRKIEKFWNKFLNIRSGGQNVEPRLSNRIIHPIGMIKLSALKLQEKSSKGFDADEKVKNDRRTAVMCSIEKGRMRIFIKRKSVSTYDKFFESFWIQRSDWL